MFKQGQARNGKDYPNGEEANDQTGPVYKFSFREKEVSRTSEEERGEKQGQGVAETRFSEGGDVS